MEGTLVVDLEGGMVAAILEADTAATVAAGGTTLVVAIGVVIHKGEAIYG